MPIAFGHLIYLLLNSGDTSQPIANSIRPNLSFSPISQYFHNLVSGTFKKNSISTHDLESWNRHNSSKNSINSLLKNLPHSRKTKFIYKTTSCNPSKNLDIAFIVHHYIYNKDIKAKKKIRLITIIDNPDKICNNSVINRRKNMYYFSGYLE
jgi:hypothetical protein